MLDIKMSTMVGSILKYALRTLYTFDKFSRSERLKWKRRVQSLSVHVRKEIKEIMYCANYETFATR